MSMRNVSAMLMPLLLFVAPTLAIADDEPALDPALPYQAERTNSVTYQVDFSAVVTPPAGTKVLKVWLPIPTSDAAQEVEEGTLSSFPDEVEPQIGTEPVFGNRFAYFEFNSPQGAQMVRHQFSIKVWELRWNLDADLVKPPSDWPDSFAPYLRGESQAVAIDDRMRELLDTIAPQRKRGYREFADVMKWVDTNFTYGHDNASLQASSIHALTTRGGHCSDYHGFCAAMGRAIGYPTRMTYGIQPMPRNSPSHCKLEAFLPPYGWVSFDVSETQKLLASIRDDKKLDEQERERLIQSASQRFSRGFRDNTWFLQTRGSDYDLVPKASRRVAVVRTIYAEADGEPLPDPDPSAHGKREFSWMTMHKYTADREVPYPFTDFSTLDEDQ